MSVQFSYSSRTFEILSAMNFLVQVELLKTRQWMVKKNSLSKIYTIKHWMVKCWIFENLIKNIFQIMLKAFQVVPIEVVLSKSLFEEIFLIVWNIAQWNFNSCWAFDNLSWKFDFSKKLKNLFDLFHLNSDNVFQIKKSCFWNIV